MALELYGIVAAPIVINSERSGKGRVLEEAAGVDRAVVVADRHARERAGLQHGSVITIGRDRDGIMFLRVTA